MSWRECAAGAVLAAALSVVVAGEAQARGSRREAAGYQHVKLATIRENPSAFIGKRVSFDCFFAGLGRIYQPFQTPFVPEQFLNFHVWEPGTRLWDNKERKNAFLFCYVPRDLEKHVDFLMRLDMYQAIRLFGLVSVVYAGQPWFEIEDVEWSPMPGFKETALKHILVGIKSLKNEDFQMAQKSFSEALSSGLPLDAQTFVQRELGRTYYEIQKFDAAAEALAEAAKMSGPDAWVLRTWGQAQSRAADAEKDPAKRERLLSEALKHLEEASRLEPANPDVHAEIGWVKAKQGKHREGIVDCRRATALKQTAPTFWILGRIYTDMKQYPDAENSYQRAIMLDPSNKVYHDELADLYMKQEKYREAESEYTNVITLSSAEPGGYVKRAVARKKRGNPDGAKQDYEAALRLSPDHLEALLGLAALYRDDGKLDNARRTLDYAATLRPDAVEVLAARGEMLLAQGAFDEAVEAYREILKKKPSGDLTEIHRGLGVALAKAKKPNYAEASKELGLAVKARPDHVEARKALAQVYIDWGRFELAAAQLQEVAKLAPNDERARLLLAQAKAEGNQIDEAIKQLRALVSARPESAYARNNLAYLLAEFKPDQLKEAMSLAQTAYETNPANATFQDTLGWVKYRSGDVDGARVLLDQAVLTAKQPEPFYHLAVLAQKTEPEIARQNLEEALRKLSEVPSPGAVTRRMKDAALRLAKELGVPANPPPRAPK